MTSQVLHHTATEKLFNRYTILLKLKKTTMEKTYFKPLRIIN